MNNRLMKIARYRSNSGCYETHISQVWVKLRHDQHLINTNASIRCFLHDRIIPSSIIHI